MTVRPRSILAGLLLACAGPALAELASVETPQGLARVESGGGSGDRLVIGDRVAVDGAAFAGDMAGFAGAYLWIEARAGTLLLVGLGSDGTACPALFVWAHAGEGDTRVTEPFGTCGGHDGGVEVSHDSETVTVSMPSRDPGGPRARFVYDGRGPVREEPSASDSRASDPPAPQPATMEPGDPDAWVGGCALDLLAAPEWKGTLVGLMGEAAYREARGRVDLCAPMERRGDWVVGTAVGNRADSGFAVGVALGAWGALAVGLRRPDGTQETWGGASPEMLAALAEGG